MVCYLQSADLLARHFSDDANGKAGPGKRLAPDDMVRHAERLAKHANFVLQLTQRLNDLAEIHMIGQASCVVVAFNDRSIAIARLDDIRIDGALREKNRQRLSWRLLLQRRE